MHRAYNTTRQLVGLWKNTLKNKHTFGKYTFGNTLLENTLLENTLLKNTFTLYLLLLSL